MYLLGIVVAITATFVISKFDGSKAEHALLIELPEYKTPNAHTIAIYVWEKVKDYLSKAGTVIFIASIIMWGVMNLGPHGFVSDISESFGAIIGKALVPLLAPAGLGYWQIAVALISGIAAKKSLFPAAAFFLASPILRLPQVWTAWYLSLLPWDLAQPTPTQ